MSNPLDVIMKELNTGGVSVEMKRQRPDGRLEETRPNELATLGTKAKLAATAKLLKNLPSPERLAWALEMKDHGNDFFVEGRYSEAMGTYVEALTAANFGTSGVDSSGENNVDSLVIPVLSNLAACCLQLGEWNKADQFCQQALQLRPHCPKALLRRGTALLKLGRYQEALTSLLECEVETATEGDGGDGGESFSDREVPAIDSIVSVDSSLGECPAQLTLSDSDVRKLPGLIRQAKAGLQRDRLQRRAQKLALAKAFGSSSSPSSAAAKSGKDAGGARGADAPLVATSGRDAARYPVQLMTLSELLWFLWECLAQGLAALLGRR